MANTWTKNYADGTALFESDLDDLAGTVQPSQANLAYSTTGSTANDVLVSTGSNATPSWSTPNTFAATITSAGANAILGVVSSAQASVSTLIMAQATGTATYSASLANSIVGALSSCQATVANLVAQAVTRSNGTAVSNLGVAISASSGSYSSSATTLTDVTNLTATITTSGRPVFITCISAETTDTANSGVFDCTAAAGTATSGEFAFLRGTTIVAVTTLYSESATAAGLRAMVPPGSFTHIDAVAAGTYTYKMQARSANATSSTVRVTNMKLGLYEL